MSIYADDAGCATAPMLMIYGCAMMRILRCEGIAGNATAPLRTMCCGRTATILRNYG
jgi:hypothetical protein